MSVTETAERTFYSLCAGLICYAEPTRVVVENGQRTVIDPRPIRFTPLGSGSPNGEKFGYYTTSNPIEIEFLEKRMKGAKDVISPEELNRRLRPAEDRASELEKTVRELQEKNRLLEELTARTKKQA